MNISHNSPSGINRCRDSDASESPAHNPATSLQHPEWSPVFDYDPAQAIESRKAILDRVATDRVMAMGYHFPFPAIGHIVRHDGAYHWEAAQWAW